MRIGIETRELLQPGTGLKTYSTQLIKYLKKVKKSSDKIFYFWGPYHGITDYLIDYNSIKIETAKRSVTRRRLWTQFDLQYELKKKRIDLYHSLSNYHLPVIKMVSTPMILSLHDIIPILFPDKYGRLGKLKYKLASRNADHILTLSKNSKNDIIKYLNIDSEDITVTPLGVDEKFYLKNINKDKLKEVKNKYGIRKKYLLVTGGTEYVKNIKMLFKVMNIGRKKFPELFENIELVITSPKWMETNKPEILGNSVNFIGYVEEKDFPVIMNGAEIFLFPSIYEGFGLPPLEAMASKTMVISSNSSSLPEVIGNAGIVIEPNNPSLWAEKISSFLKGNCREKYLKRGLERVKKFSWYKFAEKIYKVYEKTNFNK